MELYDYARTYLGTPFKHRGRDARGLDCAGLVLIAYRDAGVNLTDLERYGRQPNTLGQMMAVVREGGGDPVWQGRNQPASAKAEIQPGDVLVMRFDIEPHHLAIATPSDMHGIGMIHADGSQRVRKVVEHGMIDWHLERILAVFRRPV